MRPHIEPQEANNGPNQDSPILHAAESDFAMWAGWPALRPTASIRLRIDSEKVVELFATLRRTVASPRRRGPARPLQRGAVYYD
jgi:hypothetical protein